MIRDEEIIRLIKYAEGLGLRVSFRKHKEGLPGACWMLPTDKTNPELIIYTWDRQSKTTIILNFLHELGHHFCWIYNNRETDPREYEIFAKNDSKLSKRERKKIYDVEVEDAQYRKTIAHEVNIKIREWKIDLDIALDEYIYKVFYETGKYPSFKDTLLKKKELMCKIKK